MLALNGSNIEPANHYAILNESKGVSQDGKTKKAKKTHENQYSEAKLALLIDVAPQFLS